MLKKGLLILLVSAFSWQLAFADHEANPATMRALENVLPNAKPDRIAHSPIPGLYELTYGTDIVYVTKDGHYLLQGDIFDIQANRRA